MRQTLYGTLCGAVVFLVLSWATAKRTVQAAVLTKPPEGRFELVQLHPSQGNTWSGVLDTETGCVWGYTSQIVPSPKTANQSLDDYLIEQGSNFFEPVPFDTSSYIQIVQTAKGKPPDFTPRTWELDRVESLCDRSRVEALEAAAAR